MAENIPSGQLPTNPPRVGSRPKKGDLIGFRYAFWKHDPHPLVLVTSQYQDGRLAGINLHNLTIPDIKNLVSRYCNNNTISYQAAVKGRREIVKGFRTYKPQGIRDLRVLNCQDFLSRMGVVRERRLLSPNEVEKLRQQIQQQLRRQINPRADDLTNKTGPATPLSSIPGTPASIPGTPVGGE